MQKKLVGAIGAFSDRLAPFARLAEVFVNKNGAFTPAFVFLLDRVENKKRAAYNTLEKAPALKKTATGLSLTPEHINK